MAIAIEQDEPMGILRRLATEKSMKSHKKTQIVRVQWPLGVHWFLHDSVSDQHVISLHL
jgi:hypothetical protein